MSKLKLMSACSVAALLLSACLIPEKFVAKIEFQPDGSYTFNYSGTVINGMAAMLLKKGGGLSTKDEDALKSEATKMSKLPEVKKVVYKGSGKYDLLIQDERKPGQTLQMFDMFTIRTNSKTGVTELASPEIDTKSKADLGQIGVRINGLLEVSLPRNAEVVSSNATSTPTLGFGTYSWKIGSFDKRASMKVKFK